MADILVSEFFAHCLQLLLVHYVNHTDDFRGVMRNANAVISGSSALQFILPTDTEWTMADMDLYVPLKQFTHMVAYLEVFEKYKQAPPPLVHTITTIRDIAQVVRLIKDNHQIDVIQSDTNSALHPLAFFWTIAIINWISTNSACCAYPDLTFHKCGFINPMNLLTHTTPDARTMPLLTKYTTHWFNIHIRELAWSHSLLHAASPLMAALFSCVATMQFFGDNFSLCTSLHPYSMDAADPIDWQHITISWWWGGCPCSAGCNSALPSILPIIDDIVI